LVIEYGPLLFDIDSLDKLDLLLKTQRRIDKNTSDNLAEKSLAARESLRDAHRLWNHLERELLAGLGIVSVPAGLVATALSKAREMEENEV
jgi:hypothetical protein